MAGSDITVWYLIIDDKKNCMGQCGKVVVPLDANVVNLENKVRDENPDDFAKVDRIMTMMWKWSGGLGFKARGELDDQVKDFHQKEGVKLVKRWETLGNLQWSNENDLFVVQPHVPNDERFGPALPKVPKEYQKIVIRTHKNGRFLQSDLYLNELSQEPVVQDFVMTFQKELGRRRKVGREAFLASGNGLLPTGTKSTEAVRKAAYDKLMEALELSEADFDVNDEEIAHLQLLTSFGSLSLSRRNTTTAKVSQEDSAKALFIVPFACYLEVSLPPLAKINYGFGTDQWPFTLLMIVEVSPDDEATTEVNEQLYKHIPQSSFVLLKEDLPRLLVKAYSGLEMRDTFAEDKVRMLLQGMSVVKFANTHVDHFRDKKNFLLVAIYINDVGVAERFILYQAKDSDQVFHIAKSFALNNVDDRLKFVRELYNFASYLANEASSNALTEIARYERVIRRMVDNYKLESFASGSEWPTTSEEDSRGHFTERSRASDSGGDDDEFEAHGYEVIPETFDDGKGVWEPLIKLPPNIRNVYRASDVKRTKLIAKRIRRRSKKNKDELQILRYLHKNQSSSPHVIEFIDSIVTTTRTWVIFPKLYTIADKLSYKGGRPLRGKIEQFSWGLIKGLAYLHEKRIAHLDIKPDNLVFDKTNQLKIVDFDIAVRVKDEDEEIEGYLGTRGWTAPEVGEEDGPKLRYSAIRADRWSCGRVLLSFLEIDGSYLALSTAAKQLTSTDPYERPSLLGWRKWLESAQPEPSGSNVSDSDEEVGRGLRRGVTETEEEDVPAPISKRPRIESP